MLTGPGPRVSRSGAGGGVGFPAVCCRGLSRLFCFPGPAIFQIIQSIRMGMWAGPGGLTTPPPAGGWRTTSALSRVSVGSRQVTQKRKKQQQQKQRLRQLFPDHFIVDVRPNCFLTGHLGSSVFLSGKDILLCSWQDGELSGVCSSTVCLDSPWVSLMSACGAPWSLLYFLWIQSLLHWELLLQINVFVQPYLRCGFQWENRSQGVKIAPEGDG